MTMSQGCRNGRARRMLCSAACLLLALCVGCESPDGERFHSLIPAFHSDKVAQQEEENRKEYQQTRSKKAMRWLLANRIKSGMAREDVGHILGEDGVREANDKWIKANVGVYRVDDVTYRFGPDAEGHSVYMVFRDDRLIHFNPEHFRLSSGGSVPRPRSEKEKSRDKGSRYNKSEDSESSQ